MPRIHWQCSHGTAIVTIDNVERRNAMTLSMWEQLRSVFDDVRTDDSVRAVIIGGAGGEAFVSGADISQFAQERGSPERAAHYNRVVALAEEAVAQCPVPVIAAIAGPCFGGGVSIATACDLRIGSPQSTFRVPAARLGLGYGLQATGRLARLIGEARAAELLFAARTLDAPQARDWGLLSQVEASPLEAATRLAHAIADNAPLAVRAAKSCLRACAHPEDGGQRERAAEAVARCFASDDYAEGYRAFLEKRPPRFVGR